jgi:hypothetical protein
VSEADIEGLCQLCGGVGALLLGHGNRDQRRAPRVITGLMVADEADIALGRDKRQPIRQQPLLTDGGVLPLKSGQSLGSAACSTKSKMVEH